MSNMAARRPWYPPRLEDVAHRAGVSLASASRAFSGTSGRAPDAAQRIWDAARELGYYRQEPKRRLLVLTSEISRLGYWLTISGIIDAARRLGCHLELHFIQGTSERHDATLASALSGRIDGVIVMEFDSLGVEIRETLPVDLPVVVAGGSPSYDGAARPVPRAWIDDLSAARRATEHLIGLGHTSIAFVGIPPPAGHPSLRQVGWSRALTDAGLSASAPLAVGWSGRTGFRAATRVIAEGATAVLCGNDSLAIGMLAGLNAAGLSVPGDVSVMGVNDSPDAELTVPALSSVTMDFTMVGDVAARLALGDPSMAKEWHVEIPTELVLRGSTAAPF